MTVERFDRPSEPRRVRGRRAVRVGDVVPGVLKDLGMPSARVTRKVHEAWTRVADPSWVPQTVPVRLVGGVLIIGVASSSLRHELAQFHRERLLAVLRTALPDLPLIALQFTADHPSATSGSAGGKDFTP